MSVLSGARVACKFRITVRTTAWGSRDVTYIMRISLNWIGFRLVHATLIISSDRTGKMALLMSTLETATTAFSRVGEIVSSEFLKPSCPRVHELLSAETSDVCCKVVWWVGVGVNLIPLSLRCVL